MQTPDRLVCAWALLRSEQTQERCLFVATASSGAWQRLLLRDEQRARTQTYIIYSLKSVARRQTSAQMCIEQIGACVEWGGAEANKELLVASPTERDVVEIAQSEI